jgi:hypothetical protein
MTIAIDVCVCTYRRASLADTLRSIKTQQLPAGSNVRVIVADNDETPSARDVVRRAQTDLSLDCLMSCIPWVSALISPPTVSSTSW